MTDTNIVPTILDPRNGEHQDEMEGWEIDDEELVVEEVVGVGGNKAKSKHKAKKTKKASKRGIEQTQQQELAGMRSMEISSAADNRVEAANGDLPRLAKDANKKRPRRTKPVKPTMENEIMDHIRNEEADAESMKVKAAAHNNATREDLARLPKKMKKATRAKSRQFTEDLHVKSQDTGNSLDEALYQPLTPAHKSNLPMSIHREDGSMGITKLENARLPRRIATSEDVHEEGQHQPSEKALGKRKAVDEPVKQGPKKRVRKSSSKEAHGQDLREMFPKESSGEPQREIIIGNANDTSSLKRISKKSGKSTVNGLAKGQTQDNNDDNQSWQDIPEEPPTLLLEAADSKASEIRKSRKRRLPVDEDDGPSSQASNTSQLEPGASKAKISRTPKSAARASGTRAAPTPKSGLTVEDTTTISQAIESFREFNNLTQQEVNDIIQQSIHSSIGKGLWTSLYEDLPSISRRNIHSFCRRNFHNFEGRGVWTEDQDEDLREAYQRNPNKWKVIGQELNRFSEDARDRWRNYLVCGGNMKKDMWDKVEEAQLQTAVNECIHAIHEERRQTEASGASLADEETLIDWQKVSMKMNHTRSRLQCMYKWKRIKALSQSDDEHGNPNDLISQSWRLEDAKIQARTLSASEKLQLLRAVRDSGASREGKIPWGAISLALNEKKKRMIWKVTIRKLKNRLRGSDEMKFKDVVEHLVNIFEESSPNEPTSFDVDPIAYPNSQEPSMSDSVLDGNESDLLPTDNDGLRKSNSSKKAIKSKPRKRRDREVDANNGEGPSTSTKTKPKIRDRMRRQGESTPEHARTTGSSDEAVVDVNEDMVVSLPVPRVGKGNKRKPKSRQFLSEEKVVEDLSDDDGDVVAKDQVDEGQIDTETSGDIAVKVEAIDDQAHETESVDLDSTRVVLNHFDDYDSSSLDENESSPERAADTESVDLDEDNTITANGFEDNVDSDTNKNRPNSTENSSDSDSDSDIDSDIDEDKIVSQGSDREDDRMIYHRLADKHVERYYRNAESELVLSSSDDDSVSSIPARVERNVSIEL